MILLAATVSVPMMVGRTASATPGTDISVGGYAYACAVTAGGAARCWGDNQHGQLGNGMTTDRATPVGVSGLGSGVVAVAAGAFHACALTDLGGVKCWGLNANGQVGDGTDIRRLTPVAVSGLSSGVVAISAGFHHTCALTSGGGVKCWGGNGDGQLGDNSTTGRLTPIDASGLTSGVASVSAGGTHTCAVSTGGGAKCWGSNDYGQVGDDSIQDRHVPVDVSGLSSGVAMISGGTWHTCALTTGGAAKCWGQNEAGQIGDGTTTERHTPTDVADFASGSSIEAGTVSTCGVTDGAATCWGENQNGELGDGTFTNSSSPVAVQGLSSGVAEVSTDYLSACARSSDGRVTCWGFGCCGNLGNGTFQDSPIPVQVSGLFPGQVARPDGLISKGSGFVGGNAYNKTALGQTLAVQKRRGTTTTFTLRFQNDGDAVDRFKIRGEAPASGFTLTVTRGGTSVRTAYIAGTLSVTLAPGERADLVLKIGVKPTTVPGKVESQLARVTSTNQITAIDAVKAKVTVIR